MKRALDLFCKAGGATKGLQRAGYHVTGVDIEPQPHYCGDVFYQADAMEFDLSGYDLIWASPPCPRYSRITQANNRNNHPDLVAPIRDRLSNQSLPYIIENVEGAPLRNPLLLCGTMFGLLVLRHRLFETNPPIYFPPATCAHQRLVVTRGKRPDRSNHYASVVGHFSDVDFAREAMGIDWMTRDELANAIPPAYSYFLAMELQKYDQ
jgi:DNA (cytosine-5)-methyltransferase 1